MDLDKKAEQLIANYQKKFDTLVNEMRAEYSKLKGKNEASHEDVAVGEARKVAILTECYESELLEVEWGRYSLSEIAKKYVREPASMGVFFRPDVNLLETRGDKNRRFVTAKGRDLVAEYKQRYGQDWVAVNQELLQDPSLKATYKIKLELNNS